ncbi:MAG: hypothetical protein LUQ07_08575 [Methanospirillum sp.]|nr:hypothetical protein [Methanospirillum sp.]
MTHSFSVSGTRKILVFALAGVVITVSLAFFIDTILAGMAAIIFGTGILIMAISEDAARNMRPMLSAELSADCSEIVLENTGTAQAERIVARVAGIDTPWELGSLKPDARQSIILPRMYTRLTLVVTYITGTGTEKKRVFKLGESDSETDPFKPFFPLFNWKGKE